QSIYSSPLYHTQYSMMLRGVVIVFSISIGFVLSAGGGMAELKAITGDAPYLGQGNAPAFVPQPQGFWGRPSFYGGGMGGNPFIGNDIGGFGGGFGGNPCGGGGFGCGGPYNGGFGGPDRFTSRSGSPYGVNGIRAREYSVLDTLMDLFDVPSPSRSHPFVSSRPSIPSRISPTPIPSPPSFPISAPSTSSSTGGFYKGGGNDFVN
ncbi:hypothetical protein PFISCL1PPCAC_14655, partial [Pristionchus fissidentatus]